MKRKESDAVSCMLRLVPVSWQDYVRMAGELLVVIFWLFFVKREVERVGELAEEYGYLTAYLFHNSINTIKVSNACPRGSMLPDLKVYMHKQILQVLDFFACIVLWIVIIADPVRNNLVINTVTCIFPCYGPLNLSLMCRMRSAL